MRKLIVLSAMLFAQAAYADSAELQSAIEAARTACAGISEEMTDMKKMAGITTAVSAVGTASSGVALGAGIVKAKTDKDYEAVKKQLLEEFQNFSNAAGTNAQKIEIDNDEVSSAIAKGNADDAKRTELQNKLNALLEKSKMLGNLRTGTMAAATVTNIATAAMAGTNTVKEDLETRIKNCIARVDELSRAKMQASLDGTADAAQVAKADAIYTACSKWSTVDLAPINKRATGAAVSSGIGAGLGLAGTVTSAVANTDKTREDAEKAKGLNLTSNILAGGTAAAGLASTIFSATQISAIKRAATVADECEGAL